MKIVVVMDNKAKADILIEKLGSLLDEAISFQYVVKGRELIGDIKKQEPDLLITIDLEGFEYETIADNVAYNFLECKQVHFLFERGLKNEHYLKKMLSIAMFFYCSDGVYKEELLQKYPDLPWIKSLKEFNGSSVNEELKDFENDWINEGISRCMCSAIKEVIRECKINI